MGACTHDVHRNVSQFCCTIILTSEKLLEMLTKGVMGSKYQKMSYVDAPIIERRRTYCQRAVCPINSELLEGSGRD